MFDVLSSIVVQIM